MDWSPWSDCVDAQSNLGYRCEHITQKLIFTWLGSFRSIAGGRRMMAEDGILYYSTRWQYCIAEIDTFCCEEARVSLSGELMLNIIKPPPQKTKKKKNKNKKKKLKTIPRIPSKIVAALKRKKLLPDGKEVKMYYVNVSLLWIFFLCVLRTCVMSARPMYNGCPWKQWTHNRTKVSLAIADCRS